MTNELVVFTGPPALTQARLAAKLGELRRVDTAASGLFAEFVHFLFLRRPLSVAERRVVDGLLAYGPRHALPTLVGEPLCVVIPRPGTISPWSSKATDIVVRCGIDAIERVERGIRWHVAGSRRPELAELLHDRMTECPVFDDDFAFLTAVQTPRPLAKVALGDDPAAALLVANRDMGLALSDDEVDYLAATFAGLGRDPTDVELMMFAQANSEHCRHKIFNAAWVVDGEEVPQTLFGMIRNTHRAINGAGVLSAYSDNAAVIEGHHTERFRPDDDAIYRPRPEPAHILMKAETHNHPTAIAPYPGAATGAGGEIRDEGSVGRGSKPKAGLAGFTTSHLEIGEALEPWELGRGRPGNVASAREIMLDGPLGAAAFANEYGRPCLTGYFRTFEAARSEPDTTWGYHKPVMIAGGVGTVVERDVHAAEVPSSARLVVLGGPAMLIGLGGGAASSMASGQSLAELDFASVQRENAEMQRRCQEVIDRCTDLGEGNPIRLIHDVGAGGLANALPELVREAGLGGRFDIRAVPSADGGMSPMEIWCNESQERYVLAVAPQDMRAFEAICRRERCPFAVVGEATATTDLVVEDSLLRGQPVRLSLDALFGHPPRMTRSYQVAANPLGRFVRRDISLAEAIARVLRFPAVASKKFLVTIGDRSVTGLVARDQMAGPFQTPVADVGVTLAGFDTYRGEAMAMGERSPVAVRDARAAARLAVAEALTNLFAAPVTDLRRVVLSANWMAAAGHEGQDQALREAVTAIGEELCPALGIAVPVGKDSLSMQSRWKSEDGADQRVVSPVTLNVTAFSPVTDARRTLTPFLPDGVRELLLVAPGRQRRLGASALEQCFPECVEGIGAAPPDVDDAGQLRQMLETLHALCAEGLVGAWHDRSDGGVLVALLEMAFATRCGLDIRLDTDDALAELFAEEVGVVLGLGDDDAPGVQKRLREAGVACERVGRRRDDERICIYRRDELAFASTRRELERRWASVSHHMQRMRDDATCAEEELAAIDSDVATLRFRASFDPQQDIAAPYVASGVRPRALILREQGVNGQIEMAAAFHRAGFEAMDVHMSDVFADPEVLKGGQVLAVCGGFSYGDVLGAGGGWAKSILFHTEVRDAFAAFFAADTLSLGVCNGCQMMAQLKSLIPGAKHWPAFVANRSERFEARTVNVRVNDVDSPWLADMAGSVLPVPLAHGEGRTEFATQNDANSVLAEGLAALQFANADGATSTTYPANPNGSDAGLAGVISATGKAFILMPHPERAFRAVQNSWTHESWGEDGPWLRLFRNARMVLG